MEFKKEKVYTPLAATPTHNVSQAIKYGNLVFVSGMVGEDENEVLKEGLEAQCEQAFINMKNVLEAAGSSLEKVLFCQIFIAKREDRAIANEVWDRFFLNMDVGPRPLHRRGSHRCRALPVRDHLCRRCVSRWPDPYF